MTRPSSPECIAETARLAYHLHWPLDSILDLEHRDRRSFLAEADALAGNRGFAEPSTSNACRLSAWGATVEITP